MSRSSDFQPYNPYHYNPYGPNNKMSDYISAVYSHEYPNSYARHTTIDIKSQTNEQLKAKEIKANIPKRALMLEKASDDIISLPQLPTELWKIIAEYEGGVESSLLGQMQDSSASGFLSWCNIL